MNINSEVKNFYENFNVYELQNIFLSYEIAITRISQRRVIP